MIFINGNKKLELYEHNKLAYKKILKQFEKVNKTCIVHATGTGKSFILLKFLWDNKDKKSLFLCPTYAIINQIKRHIEENGLTLSDFPNLDFKIYSNVTGEEIGYECIVMDEFHRVGAKEWGSSVCKLLNINNTAKILGVSATPIRYLDDNRDMAEEIFNGNIASEINLAEAIARGILPVPTYITSIYSFEEEINDIQEKINGYKNKQAKKILQKRLELAKKKIEEACGLDELFYNNIININGKFIVFCRDISHMKKMEEEAKKWFCKINPNIRISDVSSEQSKEINQYTISNFENDKSNSIKLLFSVEMLNEGLHVEDIDGVIMLRPTSSPIIYQQQLGRALSVGHNDNPLIFDIVNNYACLDTINEIFEEVKIKINKVIKDRENGAQVLDYPSDDILKNILDKFIIIENYKEILEILKVLKNDVVFTWDEWYKLAKTYFEHHNNLEIPNRFITVNGYEYNENGVQLGSWIEHQRKAYNGKVNSTLSEEKIKLLEKIGMRFEVKDNSDEWYKRYKLAKAYFDYHHDLKIPYKFITVNGYEYDEAGVQLGDWIANQRQAYKNKRKYTLSEERIKLLEEIGMIWYVKDQNWDKNYKLSKIYYEHYHNLEIPRRFITINGYEHDDEGIQLGRWIITQRQAYKGQGNSTLSEERIRLLEEIGMKWFLEENDEELQQEKVTEKTLLKKQKEVLNRFYSLLNNYNGEELPSKNQINKDFIEQLNKSKNK